MAHQVEKLLSYPNIPRKKNKFLNFVKNCMGVRKPADMERIWSVVEAANQKEEQQQLADQSKEQSDRTKRPLAVEDELDSRLQAAADKKKLRAQQENGKGCSEEQGGDPSNLVTREHGNACSHFTDDRLSCPEEGGDRHEDRDTDQVKFSWKRTIKRIVRESGGKEIPLRDLQRQVSQLNPSLGLSSFPHSRLRALRAERVSLLVLAHAPRHTRSSSPRGSLLSPCLPLGVLILQEVDGEGVPLLQE